VPSDTEETRVWTRLHPETNPWRREWFAKEPCPGCGRQTVVVSCAICEIEHVTGEVPDHDACEEYAECIECNWRE